MTGSARRAAIAALVIGIAGTVSGCASADEASAAKVATAFEQAVHRQDGDAACTLLTSAAAEALASASGKACADAVVGLKIEGGAVQHTEVWGDAAIVRMAGDTVFVEEFPRGWMVSAAGCRKQQSGPYDCDVEG